MTAIMSASSASGWLAGLRAGRSTNADLNDPEHNGTRTAKKRAARPENLDEELRRNGGAGSDSEDGDGDVLSDEEEIESGSGEDDGGESEMNITERTPLYVGNKSKSKRSLRSHTAGLGRSRRMRRAWRDYGNDRDDDHWCFGVPCLSASVSSSRCTRLCFISLNSLLIISATCVQWLSSVFCCKNASTDEEDKYLSNVHSPDDNDIRSAG